MKNLELFLQESNNIEDVWDDQSYEQALKAWNYLMKHNISSKTIQKSHGILTKYLLPKNVSGKWRQAPVWIGGHEATHWQMIPHLVENWILTQVNVYPEKDTESNLRWRHIWFEKIHPFIDGNGRMGRILYNLERLKHGLEIEVIYESKKWDYYKWFQNWK